MGAQAAMDRECLGRKTLTHPQRQPGSPVHTCKPPLLPACSSTLLRASCDLEQRLGTALSPDKCLETQACPGQGPLSVPELRGHVR